MEATPNLTHALIAFINERPDGNPLRDIAIRTLVDHQRKEDCRVFPAENEKRAFKIPSPAVEPKRKAIMVRSEINRFSRINLKELRNKSQMYQIDMANKFGTSVVAYYGYENGKAAIPIDLIVNVCRAFEVSVEKFMTESL